MIRPLEPYIIVQLESAKETESGLILPTAKTKAKAQVLAVPKGEEDVAVGDTILIDKGMPYDIEVDGTVYTVIAKSDVFGVL